VGRATFQTEVMILRDDGSPAPPGEQGTIYLRSRNGVRLRYHNDAGKTEAAHRGEGLFTTGETMVARCSGILKPVSEPDPRYDGRRYFTG
jgi:acyl-coenzyme A synthetase/AMP-(fatty) acid ligase